MMHDALLSKGQSLYTLTMNDSLNQERLLAQTRRRMGQLYTGNQILGRSRTIGCVAVEITQRCNLDCTLCYLSEHSASVQDIPLGEVFRRLHAVVEHYGPGTNVQITGGDPTLRKHAELVQIVRFASQLGLRPALFTNGIAASRRLLEQLAANGLCDIAFHVDTTQRRAGYTSEAALNKVRQEYIERARNLGLMVVFNTTVHKGNFDELPALVRFFVENAGVVGFVSFQLQADTGRGEWRSRDRLINQETVKRLIDLGAATDLPWDIVRIGHNECHSYVPALVANKRVHPLIEDADLLADFLDHFQAARCDLRASRMQFIAAYFSILLRQPRWWPRALAYFFAQTRLMWKDVLCGRGKVKKLSFFIQNFMDAGHLQAERISACSFMVMTAGGPVSMCEHNARRDEYILKPVRVVRADGSTIHFEPLPRRRIQNELSATP